VPVDSSTSDSASRLPVAGAAWCVVCQTFPVRIYRAHQPGYRYAGTGGGEGACPVCEVEQHQGNGVGCGEISNGIGS